MDTVVFTQGLGTRLGPLGSLELGYLNGGGSLPVFGYEPYPLVLYASILSPVETGSSNCI